MGAGWLAADHEVGYRACCSASPDAMAEQVGELREATGISYVSVPAAHLDDVAPVVAALRGR